MSTPYDRTWEYAAFGRYLSDAERSILGDENLAMLREAAQAIAMPAHARDVCIGSRKLPLDVRLRAEHMQGLCPACHHWCSVTQGALDEHARL